MEKNVLLESSCTARASYLRKLSTQYKRSMNTSYMKTVFTIFSNERQGHERQGHERQGHECPGHEYQGHEYHLSIANITSVSS